MGYVSVSPFLLFNSIILLRRFCTRRHHEDQFEVHFIIISVSLFIPTFVLRVVYLYPITFLFPIRSFGPQGYHLTTAVDVPYLYKRVPMLADIDFDFCPGAVSCFLTRRLMAR